MTQSSNNRCSQLEAICRQAEQNFSSLMQDTKNAAILKGDLYELGDMLECLPLATDDYDLTVARINNALRYLESSEQGAARYEIRQLIRNLRNRLWSTVQSSTVQSSSIKSWAFDDEDEPSKNVVPAA